MILRCLVLMVFFSSALYGKTLTVVSSTEKKVFTKQNLLLHPQAKQLHIPLLNYPNQSISVSAVPIRVILGPMGHHGKVKFKALDGFSGLLDLKILLREGEQYSQAYLATEPQDKWPPLPKESNTAKKTAGPFYLVWVNPEKSNIPPEYWPYQLESFEILSTSKDQFANMRPKKHIAKSDPIYHGFEIFQQRCMQCHKMNGDGTSSMGPDLNLPMNPTEYFKAEALRKFIKDPASVRDWSDMKMRWVAEDSWSDKDITKLIAYLKHMASRKVDGDKT